jgi:hypothetical protein
MAGTVSLAEATEGRDRYTRVKAVMLICGWVVITVG